MQFTIKEWKDYATTCGVASSDVKEIVKIANTIGNNSVDTDLAKDVFDDALHVFLIKTKAETSFTQTNEDMSSDIFVGFVNKDILIFEKITNPLDEYLYVLGLVRLISLDETLMLIKNKGYIEKLHSSFTLNEDTDEGDKAEAYLSFAFNTIQQYIDKRIKAIQE